MYLCTNDVKSFMHMRVGKLGGIIYLHICVFTAHLTTFMIFFLLTSVLKFSSRAYN